MKRRDFIIGASWGVGAAWIGTRDLARAMSALPALPRKFSAADTVTLGKTGITTSRLAMGTGTVGSGHHSHQTALGVKGLSGLLLIAMGVLLITDRWLPLISPVLGWYAQARWPPV